MFTYLPLLYLLIKGIAYASDVLDGDECYLFIYLFITRAYHSCVGAKAGLLGPR